MISNESTLTVTPQETTVYQLKVTTTKGATDYNEIIVYVRDIVECNFNYDTGDIVSGDNILLTRDKALSADWVPNGKSVVTLEDFSQSNPHFSVANKGGLIFTSECYIPDGSETLIAAVSVENILGLKLYNNKVIISGTEYPFNEEQYITFEISLIFDIDTLKWVASTKVTNTITKETIIEASGNVDVGVFDSEIYLYLIDTTTAKAGFYYGAGVEPVVSLVRDHLSVPKGTNVILDSSGSYDVSGAELTYGWQYKPYSGSSYRDISCDDNICEIPVNESTYYKVDVSNINFTKSKEVIVTNYSVIPVDDYTYILRAVNNDVEDLYTYEWSASDGSVSSTEQDVIVQPLGTITYTCLLTEISTGIQDTIEITLEGDLRIIHAYDTINDIYQEIKVYPTTRFLDKYIDCLVDGYQGYIAVGGLDDPRQSIVRCRVDGEDGMILLHI